MTSWVQRLTEPSPTNEAPTPGELRRNDLLVAALVLFVLFLAFGIRNQVLNASTTVRLGENMPRIAYPERWRTQTTEGTLLHVINPGSSSTFDSQMVVVGRPIRTDESIEDARSGRAINLATTLPGYRELEAERMVVLDGQPALVTTYAYIADPTFDAGATGLPVVVEAQDIMFLGGGQFLAVTLAADANDWEEEERNFAIITNSLRLQPLPEEEAAAELTPVPAAPAADATPAASDAGAGETGGDSFGSGAQEESGGPAGENSGSPTESATDSQNEGGDE